MSNGSNAHIAGCKNTSSPPGAGGENFNTVLANPLTEVCDNSRDDTLDGSADCADTACHPTPTDNNPEECTGNNQTTDDCVIGINSTTGETIWADWCKNNQTGDAYYCSYGRDDDNTTDLDGNPTANPQGFCCEQGERAERNPLTGEVTCQNFDECYSETSFNPTCEFDFENTSERYFDWFSAEYDGDASDYCVSARADYYSELDNGSVTQDRSSACCRINKHGKSGYYFDDGDNVKIFG
jgi:hypothetical protein